MRDASARLRNRPGFLSKSGIGQPTHFFDATTPTAIGGCGSPTKKYSTALSSSLRGFQESVVHCILADCAVQLRSRGNAARVCRAGAWTKGRCGQAREGSWSCHAVAFRVRAKGQAEGCTRGCAAMDQRDWWGGDIDELIARLELRLEQYQLHAETLARHSRDRTGADAIVQRVQGRLDGLHEWRRKQTGQGRLEPSS
jgi:hypothetical protein